MGAPQVAYRETIRKEASQETKYARQSGGKGQDVYKRQAHRSGGCHRRPHHLQQSHSPEPGLCGSYRSRALAGEMCIRDRVNAQRAKYGLTALKMGDDALTAAAQTRAEEIAVVNSHVRPDGSKCFTVLKDYGVTDTPTGRCV